MKIVFWERDTVDGHERVLARVDHFNGVLPTLEDRVEINGEPYSVSDSEYRYRVGDDLETVYWACVVPREGGAVAPVIELPKFPVRAEDLEDDGRWV